MQLEDSLKQSESTLEETKNLSKTKGRVQESNERR